MEYNSTRPHLIMREYGRNVQKIIEYIASMSDEDIRLKNTLSMIEMLGYLNQQLKTSGDYMQKLWDHLIIISEFKLSLKSPYPLPNRENVFLQPSKDFGYPSQKPKFKNLGKNLEMLVQKGMEETDEIKKKAYVWYIIQYIKVLQQNSNKENISEESIKADLKKITSGHFSESLIDPTFYYIDESVNRPTKFKRASSNRQGFDRKNGGYSNRNYSYRKNRNSR